MLFVNFFLNIITYLALIIMTVCSVPLFFWLLFIKKTSRFPIASKLIFGPWSFIINRILCHINLKIKGQEFIDKKRKTIYICNHQSWLDITTFINSTGAVPISKEEVKKIPGFNIFGREYFKSKGYFDYDDWRVDSYRSSFLNYIRTVCCYCRRRGVLLWSRFAFT